MKRPHATRSASRQRGAVLMVVMVLLVVMSLLGAASMKGALFQERMSASQLDRSLAFQATEAALRAGEQVAAGKPAVPSSGCSNGLCGAPTASAAGVWTVESNWTSAYQLAVDLNNVSVRPRYIVERLKDDVPAKNSCTTTGDISVSECSGTEHRYRITARTKMPDRSTVVLQSIYAVP